MDYKIAIPSYNRSSILLNRTINMLVENNISLNKVHVFVVEEEYSDYVNTLPKPCKIVVGRKGIAAQRNFIATYFLEGQPIVSLDDDIKSIQQLNESDTSIGNTAKKTNKIYDLETLIYNTFFKLNSYGLTLASIYPVNNYFFMRHNETLDCRFCMGAFRIYFNIKKLEIRTYNLLEDYETTLKYYQHFGGVLRINNTSIDVNYKTLKGGICSKQRNPLYKRLEVLRFLEEYPLNCKVKKSGMDIRLKN